MRILMFCFASIILNASTSFGQEKNHEKEIIKVVEATLNFISMEKGAKPKWDIFRNYFAKEASFIFTWKLDRRARNQTHFKVDSRRFH